MGYKDYHNVPYNSKIEEAIVGSFSWGQLLWLVPAVIMSLLLFKLPPLPIDNFVYARVYVVIPVGIAFLFITFKHPKTKLTLSKYILLMIRFKRKRKRYTYQRENLTAHYRQHGKGEFAHGKKTKK